MSDISKLQKVSTREGRQGGEGEMDKEGRLYIKKISQVQNSVASELTQS